MTERKEYQKKVLAGIREFDEDMRERMKVYHEIKAENDNFTTKFKQTEKITDYNKAKKTRGVNKTDNIFHNIIIQYQNKGYKIPELDTQKNLFEPSPLLLENNKLEDYYQFLVLNGPEKNQNYLVKLNAMMNEKIQSEELQDMNKQISLKRGSTQPGGLMKMLESDKDNVVETKTKKEILQEIQENEIYIAKMHLLLKEEVDIESLKKKREKSYSNLNISTKFNILGKGINMSKKKVKTEQIMQQSKSIDHSETSLLNNNSRNSRANKKNNRSVYFSNEIDLINLDEKTNVDNKSLELESDPIITSTKKKKSKFCEKNSLLDTTKAISELLTNNQTLNSQNNNSKGNIINTSSLNIRTSLLHSNSPLKKLNRQSTTLKRYPAEADLNNFTNAVIAANNNNSNNLINSIDDISPISRLNEKVGNVSPIYNTNDRKSLRPLKSIMANQRTSLKFSADPKRVYGEFHPHLQSFMKQKEIKLNEREIFLYYAYDQINNLHDAHNVKDSVASYAKKFLKYDDKSIEDVLNKKPEPVHILKSILELKTKVDLCKIPEKLMMMFNGYNEAESAMHTLSRISELDKQIRKLDLELAKNLNKKS